MRMLRCVFLFLASFSFVLSAQTAAPTASVSGTITTPDKVSIASAEVRLVDLRRVTTTDVNGQYRFESVPAGRHVLQVTSPRYGTAVREINVGTEPLTVDLLLDVAVHAEEIVVTASSDPRAASQVYQPVDVMAAEELQARGQPTLGETLAQQPGVTSTGFVAGSSRPVIRGFGGDRIRILEDGIGTGDASNVSQDHNVSVDPANARSIEIVRGAATLLYGSNAVGGVVNVLDDRIPTTKIERALTGSAEIRLGSVAEERNGNVSLDGGAGAFAWHGNVSARNTGDVDTPLGTLINSGIESRSGALGGSWVHDRGFLGIGYSGFDTDYGVSDAGPDVEPEERVRIDMRQRRWDLKSEYAPTGGVFSRYRLRFGKTDYNHFEVVDGAPETGFANDFTEGRFEATHRAIGAISGSFGVQASSRDLAVTSEESLLPPTNTRNTAAFAFEELTTGRWRWQVGARYERQAIDVMSGDLPDRTFSGVSGSGGVIWLPNDTWSLALTASRSVRSPVAEELYYNGPHEATFQFQIGSPDLREEVGTGLDLGLRKRAGRVTGEASVFVTNFNGYIFENPTGETEDDLPVFRFEQADARFHGAEAHADVDVLHRDPHHVALELSADYVRARLRDGGEPLPFIPPFRYGIGLRYQGAALSANLEVRRTSRQNRVAAFETPTDGYTLVNASIGYRLFVAQTVHDLMLRGTNLTDEIARNHLNPLKDVVPLPGRDVSLSYRVTF